MATHHPDLTLLRKLRRRKLDRVTVVGADALVAFVPAGGQLPEPQRTSSAGIHLPSPTIWPVITAIGAAAVFVMLMMLPVTGPLGVVAAVAVLFTGVYRWAFTPV